MIRCNSGEIADEEQGKCDDDSSESEKKHVSNIMSGYALPFWDISHNSWWLFWRCFEMVA